MKTTTIESSLQINNENINDAYTGIYISSVLLILLSLFIIYFFYLFFKRKRKLRKLRKKAEKAAKLNENNNNNDANPIDNQHSNNQDDENCFLLKTINETGISTTATTDENPLVYNSSRKNSELIEYLISKHYYSIDKLNSRKCSLFTNTSNSNRKYQNQMLNSKVSLILLSSLVSQQEDDFILSNERQQSNSNISDKDLSIFLNNLLNKNTLDKETANKLSDTIAKYYANRRKVLSGGSLSSANKILYRSKSICALSSKDFNRNRLKASFKTQNSIAISKNDKYKHRRVVSEKGSTRLNRNKSFNKTPAGNLLSVPDTTVLVDNSSSSGNSINSSSNRGGRRQWASEKRNSKDTSKDTVNKNKNINDYSIRRNSFQHNSIISTDNSQNKLNSQSKASSTASSKSSKPTTIYELYKSNKLHVSSLFDGGDDDD